MIDSMMIMDDAPALVELMRREEDPALRKDMLEMLTVMDSEEAEEYLFELLENGQ